jgi:hypothetical protein
MSETDIADGTCEHAGYQNVTIRFLEGQGHLPRYSNDIHYGLGKTSGVGRLISYDESLS